MRFKRETIFSEYFATVRMAVGLAVRMCACKVSVVRSMSVMRSVSGESPCAAMVRT